MAVHITSTTDSKEQVEAALRGATSPDGIPRTAEQAEAQKAAEAAAAEAAGGGEKPTEAAKPAEGQKPRKSAFQARIDQEVRRTNDERRRAEAAEAEADRLRRELEAASARPAAPATKVEEKPSTPSGLEAEPDLDDFDSIPEWQKAHSAWTIKAAEAKAAEKAQSLIAERERVAREEDQRRQQNALAQARQERIESFMETHEDYDTEVSKTPISPVMQAFLNEVAGEQDVELAYHLAKNPALADKIARERSPLKAASMMAEALVVVRGAKTSAPARPATRPLTKAPEPASEPVGAGRVSSGDPVAAAVKAKDFQAFRAARRG